LLRIFKAFLVVFQRLPLQVRPFSDWSFPDIVYLLPISSLQFPLFAYGINIGVYLILRVFNSKLKLSTLGQDVIYL